MRSYPIKYGFFLNEFDPYFNYRATKYMIENGYENYWKWRDNMSWYPEGRDVPKTSQTGLHVFTFLLYNAIGGPVSLLDFTIILPAIMGSLTTIIVFALVRTITASSTAGMFSAIMLAFSPAVIQRGNLGWFKSEPIALFLGLASLYLLISSIKQNDPKYTVIKAIAGGITFGLANTSWGGSQYFVIPISAFFICIPFFRRDTKASLIVAVIFTLSTMMIIAAFPRPGISFIFGLPGIALIFGTVFLTDAHYLKRLFHQSKHRLIIIILLISFVATAAILFGTRAYYASDFRYINAINPLLPEHTSITATVSEHIMPSLVDYFRGYSVLLIFAGFGAWMCFKRRDYLSIFALILAITAIYVSSGLIRLLVFASIGIVVLAGIGLSEVTRSVLTANAGKESVLSFERLNNNKKFATPDNPSSSVAFTRKALQACKKWFSDINAAKPMKKVIKIAYMVLIIIILLIPMVYPSNQNWMTLADIPPTILNGGAGLVPPTLDWVNALNWVSKNTSEDAIIAAWWDYGYWITTLGNRTTLADNATINQTRLAIIAKMFMDRPDDGIKLAVHNLGADYILTYVVAQPIRIHGNTYYILGYGGDESKTPTFMRTAGIDERTYIEKNRYTSTFWNTTLIGSLIPFTRVGYTLLEEKPLDLFQDFKHGAFSVYLKKIKYPERSVESEVDRAPLSLVYSSESFTKNGSGVISTILIYKINNS